jgi:hypothetical protein
MIVCVSHFLTGAIQKKEGQANKISGGLFLLRLAFEKKLKLTIKGKGFVSNLSDFKNSSLFF